MVTELALAFAFACSSQNTRYCGMGESCKIDSYCLHGAHKAGKNYTLYDRSGSKKCKARTQKVFQNHFVAGNFTATLLKTQKCDLKSPYLATKGSKKLKLRWLPLKKSENKTAKRNAQQTILKRKLIEAVFKSKVDSIDYPRDFVPKQLPEMYEFHIDGKKILLLRFANKYGEKGPLFQVVNSKPQAMEATSICSLKLATFQLAKSVYLEAGRNCCECGFFENQLFVLTKKGFKLVLQNSDFST